MRHFPSRVFVSSVLCTSLALLSLPLAAAEKTVTINAISADGSKPGGIGAAIGTISFSDSDSGLVIKPALKQLSPGSHGFHLHEKASCDAADKDGKMVAGQAAGGHYDPAKTGMHAGPMGEGHHGDLPALVVDSDGNAVKSVVAPHLKLADIAGHAVIIHEGGDNYSDTPKPLGGGGGRVACGIIE